MIILLFHLLPQFKYMNYFIYTSRHCEYYQPRAWRPQAYDDDHVSYERHNPQVINEVKQFYFGRYNTTSMKKDPRRGVDLAGLVVS